MASETEEHIKNETRLHSLHHLEGTSGTCMVTGKPSLKVLLLSYCLSVNIPHQYQLFAAAESQELDKRTIENLVLTVYIDGSKELMYWLYTTTCSTRKRSCCVQKINAGIACSKSAIAEHGFNLTVILVDGDENLSRNCKKTTTF